MNPRLKSLAPQPARSVQITSTPFWIGTAASADYRVDAPTVRGRHAAIIERADGYWLVKGEGDVTVDGRSIDDGVRLDHGSVLELARGCRISFDDAPLVAPPQKPVTPPPRRRSRRPLRDLLPSWHLSPRVTVLALGAALALAASGILLYRGVGVGKPKAGELSLDQELVLDSLLREASDHIERGNTYLALDLRNAAAEEFVNAVNVVRRHPLNRFRAVSAAATDLEGVVVGLYQAKRLVAPRAFANAPPPSSRRTGGFLAPSLSVDEFAQRFAEVQAKFLRDFGSSLFVTGTNHQEHLSLYGPNGAIDVRTRDLTPEQVAFVRGECQRRGIRVKDFSSDSILQAQVAAATRAGRPDLAGTGLHLHVDRFANRRDRWTVPAS